MFTRKNWLRLALVISLFGLLSPRSSAQTISCSSDDGHRHSCPADTRGEVRMVKQNSESPCQQGYGWGVGRDSIWVDHGCRADFVVEPYRERQGQGAISCSSDDGDRHYCPVNERGRVRLVQQRSETACKEGYSWGSNARGIWVDHGCRADFVVEGDRDRGDRDEDRDRAQDRDRDRERENRGDSQSDQDQVISCASDDMHRHYCQADTRGGVRLLKQNSDSSCRQGESWGYDQQGIWVDHGCRGDFQLIR